ncbi:DEAD/DEAH box helicase [Pseudodesulfovibrio sp. F-1]|uniref:DEAD/DEAH box helicase n=1 Tax=Pseudodesulfovibrio alkaliphilus TaxID=2661613 RepID=A0A7K1KPI7_9BACT|nr:DEAD/DEAH box helicase [Pseudodesulfovibrio alkaliphilus]MUM78004.1 DEAD/DEAH box helicase [Pseudodesulfovibrio alkaliphilus]
MENHSTRDTSDQTSGTGAEPQTITFDALPGILRQACDRAGWTKLMPVQEKAIPLLLDDRDVMVQARTGSGKTGAFVLPLLDKLDPDLAQCQALVMVPTRELARQVADEARMLSGERGIGVVAVYGGVGYKEQLDAFREGAHLVVGTPGRILDHLVRRNLTLDHLKALIFDEADRMLSVGFYPDMVEVKRYLPRSLRGAFMFSATFPQSVLRLAEEFMHKPEFLSLSSEETNISAIAHQFVEVPAMGKERKLIKLIELENPTSAIIFSNTKRNVEFTAALLAQFGFDAEGLTSDLTQAKRESLMARIKAGKLRFLVATDVAARGIDIPELSHVFMLEPPEDPESYVHRAGRTGRAGATGTAITLVDVIQRMELERIAARFSIHFEEIKDPTDEDVAKIIEERLTALLEKKFRKLTNLERERAARFLSLACKYADNEESLGLLAMLLDELYQNALHGKRAAEPAGGTQPAPARESRTERGDNESSREGRRRGRGKKNGSPEGERPLKTEQDREKGQGQDMARSTPRVADADRNQDAPDRGQTRERKPVSRTEGHNDPDNNDKPHKSRRSRRGKRKADTPGDEPKAMVGQTDKTSRQEEREWNGAEDIESSQPAAQEDTKPVSRPRPRRRRRKKPSSGA